MFRRIQTRGLPGEAGTDGRFYSWDFRSHGSGWRFELPTWADGSPRRPEQVAWLARHRFAIHSDEALPPADLERLTAALEPSAELPWAAYQAHDDIRRLAKTGHGDQACALSEELVSMAPKWANGHYQRVVVLVQQKHDPDAAEAALQETPPELLTRVQRRSLRMTIAHARKDWNAYARETAEMIADGERSAVNWETLGLVLWAAERTDEAMAAFEEGLSEHPDNRDLTIRQIELLDATGRTPEAIDRLDAILAEDSAHAKTWALRGWMRRQTDPKTAGEDYAEALQRDPKQPVARVGRGLQRLAAGDREGAREDIAPFVRCGWIGAAQAWATLCAGEE